MKKVNKYLRYSIFCLITILIAFFTAFETYYINDLDGIFEYPYLIIILWVLTFLGVFILVMIVFYIIFGTKARWIKRRDYYRLKISGRYRGKYKLSIFFLSLNYSIRIILSILFLIFIPYNFWSLIIILIIIELMDAILDSAFSFILKGKWRNYSFLLDDLVDWVTRLILFIPWIITIWWISVFVCYHFILVVVKVFTPELRWLKIAGLDILYIMPFYLYIPAFFGVACFIIYIGYIFTYWQYFMEIEYEYKYVLKI